MKTYRVVWEIDIEADNPRDAAAQALASMRRDGTTATVFDVTDADTGQTQRIDLLDDFEENEGNE